MGFFLVLIDLDAFFFRVNVTNVLFASCEASYWETFLEAAGSLDPYFICHGHSDLFPTNQARSPCDFSATEPKSSNSVYLYRAFYNRNCL